MLDVRDLAVFDRYRNAGGHAFSSGQVSEEDKDAYNRVFISLTQAAAAALSAGPLATQCETWSTRFYRSGGVQGQRPVDLWASIINRAPDSFGQFPQIYAIASEQGLEVGFSASIHEDDYYNAEIKARNREIIPALYRRLPDPDDAFTTSLSGALEAEGGWHYGVKNRQGAAGSFASLPDLFRYLKTEGPERGGGSIYRFVPIEEVGESFDIEGAFGRVVARFAELMQVLRPSASEQAYLSNSEAVRSFSEQLPEVAEGDSKLGKLWLLQQVAVRQGQAKFRDRLIDAYGGRCAFTGTSILAALQAAHIEPYNGPATNHVSNGILLRADVHNLFDLGLLQVEPTTLNIVAAPPIRETPYGRLHGRALRLPKYLKHRPSVAALMARWVAFRGDLMS